MQYILIGILTLIGIFAFFWLIPVALWLEAWSSNAKVSIIDLVGMRLRRIPPASIVKPRIAAVNAGLQVTSEQLQQHHQAGGNVGRVVAAMVSAYKAGLRVSFDQAKKIDLAGRDVLEAIQMTVLPKVITTPTVAAVAKDGIQLKAVTRVTVRADIDKLVGGAGEETIIARVGEGIVSTIGSSQTHKDVLENPDTISKTVLKKGLDAGTAFEILSIDIADVDVGTNIGAKLQEDQAEADKNVAQAKAESRRAMAVAQEQEMKARAEEMRAHLIEAEAKIPMAIANAFEKGHLGVMDYYRMRNILSDTEMRKGIADSTAPGRNEDPKGNN